MSRRFDRRGSGPTDRLLRRGLAGVRSARPSTAVWSRIEAELGPPRDQAPRSVWRFSLPLATLAAAICLVLLGGLGLGPGVPGSVGRLDEAEQAGPPIQAERVAAPVAVPLRLAVTLPLPGRAEEPPLARLPGWHRPQLALNHAPWPMALTRTDLDWAEAMAEARLE